MPQFTLRLLLNNNSNNNSNSSINNSSINISKKIRRSLRKLRRHSTSQIRSLVIRPLASRTSSRPTVPELVGILRGPTFRPIRTSEAHTLRHNTGCLILTYILVSSTPRPGATRTSGWSTSDPGFCSGCPGLFRTRKKSMRATT